MYFPILNRIADGYFDDSTNDEQLYNRFLHLLRSDDLITDPEERTFHIPDMNCKHCRATITAPDRLRAHLREVRRRGWAISFEETDNGVWGIALPIVDEQGMAVAAVGLAGPRRRLDASQVRHQLTELHEAAESVANRLGYRVPMLDLAPVARRPRVPA